MFFLFTCSIAYRIKFLSEMGSKNSSSSAFVSISIFYYFSILNSWFNVGMFSFLCSRGLNKSSTSSSSNWLGRSKKWRFPLILRLLLLSSSSFLFLFDRFERFIWKFSSKIRSETAWKLRSLAPLKISYERFLYNSVIVLLSIDLSTPKNIPSAHRNLKRN